MVFFMPTWERAGKTRDYISSAEASYGDNVSWDRDRLSTLGSNAIVNTNVDTPLRFTDDDSPFTVIFHAKRLELLDAYERVFIKQDSTDGFQFAKTPTMLYFDIEVGGTTRNWLISSSAYPVGEHARLAFIYDSIIPDSDDALTVCHDNDLVTLASPDRGSKFSWGSSDELHIGGRSDGLSDSSLLLDMMMIFNTNIPTDVAFKINADPFQLIQPPTFRTYIDYPLNNRYWVNDDADGLWNNANNWSETSGGTGSAGVPTNISDVIFDSGSIDNCTCDVAININKLNVTSGYAGTLDLGDPLYSHVIAGDVLLSGAGLIDWGNNTITCSGNFDCYDQLAWATGYGNSVLVLNGVNKTLRSNGYSHRFYKIVIDGTITVFTPSIASAVSNITINAGKLF